MTTTITENGNTQIETNQITFGKLTQRFLLSILPNAKTKIRVGANYLIKDSEGNTIATWHKRISRTGLIVILS